MLVVITLLQRELVKLVLRNQKTGLKEGEEQTKH